MFDAKQTKFDPLYARKLQKHLKNPLKSNLARNIKHMTIFLDSKHFNIAVYTKWCCVQGFVPKKTSLNQFMRKNSKNAYKTLRKQLSL